jgi:hypothetical protein
MYWLSYEGTLFMGVQSVQEVMTVLRQLRAQNSKGKVTIQWVHIKGLEVK